MKIYTKIGIIAVPVFILSLVYILSVFITRVFYKRRQSLYTKLLNSTLEKDKYEVNKMLQDFSTVKACNIEEQEKILHEYKQNHEKRKNSAAVTASTETAQAKQNRMPTGMPAKQEHKPTMSSESLPRDQLPHKFPTDHELTTRYKSFSEMKILLEHIIENDYVLKKRNISCKIPEHVCNFLHDQISSSSNLSQDEWYYLLQMIHFNGLTEACPLYTLRILLCDLIKYTVNDQRITLSLETTLPSPDSGEHVGNREAFCKTKQYTDVIAKYWSAERTSFISGLLSFEATFDSSLAINPDYSIKSPPEFNPMNAFSVSRTHNITGMTLQLQKQADCFRDSTYTLVTTLTTSPPNPSKFVFKTRILKNISQELEVDREAPFKFALGDALFAKQCSTQMEHAFLNGEVIEITDPKTQLNGASALSTICHVDNTLPLTEKNLNPSATHDDQKIKTSTCTCSSKYDTQKNMHAVTLDIPQNPETEAQFSPWKTISIFQMQLTDPCKDQGQKTELPHIMRLSTLILQDFMHVTETTMKVHSPTEEIVCVSTSEEKQISI